MNPHLFYQGLTNYFHVESPNKFLCPASLIFGKIKLDIVKFDDWLHRKHGDYEDEGMSMSDLILSEYGKSAHSFIKEHL